MILYIYRIYNVLVMEEKSIYGNFRINKLKPNNQSKDKEWSLLKKCLSAPKKQHNIETCPTSVNTSLNPSYLFTPDSNHDQQLCQNDSIKSKASFLMSLNRTMEAQFSKTKNNSHRSNQKRQIKLSFMVSPKKKASQIIFRGTCKPNCLIKERQTDNSRQVQTMKFGQMKNYFDTDSLQKPQLTPRNQTHIASLQHYFTLAFTKYFAKDKFFKNKQRVTLLTECIQKKYKQNPSEIVQDVKDIKSIERVLKHALHSKQKNLCISPSESLDINGDLARLFFNMTHLIVAWRYKNYDLAKIYLELEYYSRKLKFHQLTLRLCFEIGNIFNLRHDDQNSHKYFTKALKLAIYMGDTFNEEKAIDRLGVSNYMSSNITSANYYHLNIHNLSSFDRQMIKESYSNQKQIQILTKLLKNYRYNFFQTNNKNSSQQQQKVDEIFRENKENYHFETQIDFPKHFELQNRQNFQKNISKFIACPDMRVRTLAAKKYIDKMDKIGKMKRLKNWDGRLLKGLTTFKQKQQADSSNQVLLTHRSLNRINPQLQIREIKRQKMLLIQLVGYFTNSMINNFI